MAQASKGDKAWEDGGVKKTVAHAIVGATVAAIGNGDAVGGALGAGARELASKATKDKDKTTQQVVSTLIGGAVSGGTGASVALKGEKFNRQLHQKEIELINKYAKDFAKEKGISEEKAKELLSKAALHNVDSWYKDIKVDKDAEAFILNLSKENGNFITDDKGRRQHLFDERDNQEIYNNHAINANTLFDKDAQSIYKNSGYNSANIVRSVANSAQLQGESKKTQIEFIKNSVQKAKETNNEIYKDAAIRATIDARVNGVVSASYDTNTPVGWAMDQNVKNYGKAMAVASVGNIKSNGNVIVKLANGKRVEVPKEAVVKGSDGKVRIDTRYLERDGKNTNTALHEKINGRKPTNLSNGRYKVDKYGNVKEYDSKGNVVSREPKSIQDQMVQDVAYNGAGEKLDIKIKDPKFPNHDKYQYSEESTEGIIKYSSLYEK